MKKLEKDSLPTNHTFSDFVSFGPCAEKDGEFDSAMLADLGCFNDSGVDTNKQYFAAVVQSSITNEFYSYFEWGKVGASHRQFQFLACDSKEEAIKEFQKQLHSKNDKRGEWFEHSSLGRILRAKKGKDCYLVRQQASRNVNIISARNITNIDATKRTSDKDTKDIKVKKKPDIHPECSALLRDLQIGSLTYTRNAMVGGDVPTQSAIDEARLILKEASLNTKNAELKELTRILYCKVPKVKYKGVDVTLSANNLVEWSNDLDAFESAISSSSTSEVVYDNFIPIDFVPKNSELFKEIDIWINNATRNVHSYIPNKMKIRNIFKLNNDKQLSAFKTYRANIIAKNAEKPLHQPKYVKLKSDCEKSNTATLFHGTRSVNASGILKSGKLLLPKALAGVSINGAMFGPGSYFADDWKKSAGYCSIDNSYWSKGSGKLNARKAFMFISYVVLGVPHVVYRGHGFNQPPSGHHSVFGKAGQSLANNELIVYDENAHLLDYLIEFEV